VFPDVTKRLDDMDVREYSAGAALAALSLWLDAVADVARRRPERLPEQVVTDAVALSLPPSHPLRPLRCLCCHHRSPASSAALR
jgi:hypothetical protein